MAGLFSRTPIRNRPVAATNGNGAMTQAATRRYTVAVDLHPGLSYVTVAPNLPDQPSRVFDAQVPNRVRWVLKSGTVPIMKLADAGGNEISRATRLFIVRTAPQQVLSGEQTELTYSNWYDLSLDQQADSLVNASLRLSLTNGELRFREAEHLQLWMLGPDVIDWTNPGTVLSLRVIEERIQA